MRHFFEVNINTEIAHIFSECLLNWSNGFEQVCVLDSNELLNTSKDGFRLIAGVGSICNTNDIKEGDSFVKLKKLHDKTGDWLFGHLGYDLKNEIEQLASNNFDEIKFPDSYFFQPRYIFLIVESTLRIGYLPEYDNEATAKKIADEILTAKAKNESRSLPTSITPRINTDEYLKYVGEIQEHIKRGNIYELNFCQEFYSEHATIDPLKVYKQLNEISQAPFSAFYKLNDKYLLCASPERFLKKKGSHIMSQPIKGTSRRGETMLLDAKLVHELKQSEKERNENVMIVDLVRNDLSRIAKKGTVKVDELFGVYSFKQVHQMISTVSCDLSDNLNWVDALRNMFPMGSMTGAPKIRAMQLSEQYESTKRGLYSGALGYITPNGDFDFNVVIRSILYNETKKYVSFMVGSAITAKSEPKKEYEECLLKAKAMLDVLGVDGSEKQESKNQDRRTNMSNERTV